MQSTTRATGALTLEPPAPAGAQGHLADADLETFRGLAAADTLSWQACPNTPTAGRDCCVGGTQS
jgi:hypothetical protein